MSRSEPKQHKDTDGAQQDDQRIQAFVAADSNGGRYVIGEGVDADALQISGRWLSCREPVDLGRRL